MSRLAFVIGGIAGPMSAASASHPACTAVEGAKAQYEATQLPVEAAGGNFIPMVSWRKPGAPMVGSLHYEWGFLLSFDDPRLRHFDRPTPALHSALSGCWVGYHVRPVKQDDGRLVNAVVDASYMLNPWGDSPPIFETPKSVPKIPGYRYVAASKVWKPPYEWIGIWIANRSSRSAIVAFGQGQKVVLATLPYRLTGITTLPAPDAPPVGITVVGDSRQGAPFPLIELTWVPGMEKDKE